MTDDDKIRVLIVDDVVETRENIRRLLQFENDVEVVGVAGTGRGAVDTAKELRPDVVLMDINMPDMDGITATEQIRKANPSTQIVILSVHGDPNYMRRAMLAGARDFLTKPPSVDELTSAIRRAGKMAHEEREKAALRQPVSGQTPTGFATPFTQGCIIVVYSPKGGTGVTTLAVNLAVALKNGDSEVVLVDGNLQFGDVSVFLNEQVRNSILDLAPRADELDAEIIEEVLISHASTGVKILAAAPKPEYAENVSGEQFGKVLSFLRKIYTYVIIDSSPILTDVILSAMDLSDLIILITTQDIPAIKNARLYLDLADVLGIERQRILFVMNRFDRRIGIMPEKVGESFKHEIVAVIPVEERTVLPSINRGVPFITGDQSRPITKSIFSLVELIKQRISTMENPEEVVNLKR
jgi:pilus assembly protein CpaE